MLETILLSFFFLSILGIFVGGYYTIITQGPWLLLAITLFAFALPVVVFTQVRTEYIPVKYTTETTSFKTFAITDKKVFESSEKIDAIRWTSSNDGFILTSFNSFGDILGEKFTVEKPNNEK